MWRLVEPTRQQDDFGPTEWITVPWEMSGFEEVGSSCELLDGSNGTVLQAKWSQIAQSERYTTRLCLAQQMVHSHFLIPR